MRPVDAGADGPACTSAASRPYDATHLGHAATYVTFDLVGRALRDAGHGVHYVQNVTDVDDPLLERAARDGVDWRELADGARSTLFREDMTALAVMPPDALVGVVEVDARRSRRRGARLLAEGRPTGCRCPTRRGDGRRRLPRPRPDDRASASVSGWTPRADAAVFADRGGDPDRAGKRDPLDPLLWRAAARRRAVAGTAAARRGPARLAHRVHGHRAGPPRAAASTSRAAAPTWSSRTTR